MATDSEILMPTTSSRSGKSRKKWWIILGIIILLAWLLDFNPLHPILWFHQAQDAARQGHEARLRDDSIAAANEAAQRRALRQHHAAPVAHP